MSRLPHALVVGGTGMPRDVSLKLVRRGLDVSVVAPRPERLARLQQEAGASSSRAGGLPGHWCPGGGPGAAGGAVGPHRPGGRLGPQHRPGGPVRHRPPRGRVATFMCSAAPLPTPAGSTRTGPGALRRYPTCATAFGRAGFHADGSILVDPAGPKRLPGSW